MFLLYPSDQCNTSGMVFHWCYVIDLHTTHAVVCWVTTHSTNAPNDVKQLQLQMVPPFGILREHIFLINCALLSKSFQHYTWPMHN
jgi:hypothetical protein